jgi:hypothetical protein
VAFQESETERSVQLKTIMTKFCEAERASINARSELLDTLEEAVKTQNPTDDIALFINQNRQVELTHKFTNAIEIMEMLYKQT